MLDKFKPLVTDRKMLVVFLLGIWSGTPLLLTAGTLQAWCKEAGMGIESLGLLAMLQLPYSIKFLWSPMLDWYVPKFLGRRRGWLIMSQLGVVGALLGLATADPAQGAIVFLGWAFLVALASATQDIAIDAYQIEILPPEQYGLGNQLYILGYRIGMLVASSGALILADSVSWAVVYTAMAAVMALSILTTFFAHEPDVAIKPPKSLKDAVWHPLKDFFSASGSFKGKALWIVGFFLLYKVGGDMVTNMTTPFYMELGYSKTQIGAIAKSFGLGATIIGGLIGGFFIVAWGIRKSLWVFGILQAFGYLAFVWLGQRIGLGTVNPDVTALALAITVEYLAVGLATAAYSTYMGTIVNRNYTATQYALLSSFMGLARTTGGSASGFIVAGTGWNMFFVFCSLTAIPGLFILWKLQKGETSTNPASARLAMNNA